jgi:hypothetical protein
MQYRPGDTVPRSGVYRVEHHSHRLMHEATLVAESRFPVCKQCRNKVRFCLLRPLKDRQALPFHSHTLLEEYSEPEPPLAEAV